MLQRLRHRVQGQEGFTLIELLVVILIIGILAAVAIPTFLSQTNKANDSNVQAALSTAQTTEATYQTSNDKYDVPLTSADSDKSSNDLIAIEPALGSSWTDYSMSVDYLTGTDSTAGYVVNGTDSKDKVTYTLSYDASDGSVTKSCTPKNTGACNADSKW